MPPDAFEQRLLDEARHVSIASNPFVRGVRDGLYPRAALRPYAAGVAVAAEKILYTLAAILAYCDRAEVRRELLANLLEEEGVVSYRCGEGIEADPERHHPRLAWRFARAAGVTNTEAGPHLPQVDWITSELNAGRWIGPLAYISVGTEVHVPCAFGALAYGLRTHYGFAEKELEYFAEHVGADEVHGRRGAAVLAAAAGTPEERGQALEGARRGALGFWQFHKRHDRAARLYRQDR